MVGGELAIMEAPHMPLLSTRVTTDPPATDLRPMVAAELRHRPMLSAMAHTAAVAVPALVVMHAVQAARPGHVHLVHVVQELHLQAR